MVAISPKKVLADLGYPISKVAPAARTLAATPRPTQGWLVEFVGPSGVGKTTLRQQVEAILRKDWFFEHHAKGLIGHLPEEKAASPYIKRLFADRLADLQTLDLPLEDIAATSQRVCEVVRLGLVSKSPGLPRGFVMDDGLVHFFAGQILEQDRAATQAFLAKTAFVFLMPGGGAQRPASRGQARTQMDVYCDMLDLLRQIGRPVLALDSDARSDHADQVLSFFANSISDA